MIWLKLETSRRTVDLAWYAPLSVDVMTQVLRKINGSFSKGGSLMCKHDEKKWKGNQSVFRVDLDVKTWNVQAACKGSGLFGRGCFILPVFYKVLWSGICFVYFLCAVMYTLDCSLGQMACFGEWFASEVDFVSILLFEGKWFSIQVTCSTVHCNARRENQ